MTSSLNSAESPRKSVTSLADLQREIDRLQAQRLSFSIVKGDTLSQRIPKEISKSFPGISSKEAQLMGQNLLAQLVPVQSNVFSSFDCNRIEVGDQVEILFLEGGNVRFKYSAMAPLQSGEVTVNIKTSHTDRIHEECKKDITALREELHSPLELSDEEQILSGQIDKKIWNTLGRIAHERGILAVRTISIDDLLKELTPDEQAFMQKLLAIPPELLGVKGSGTSFPSLSPKDAVTAPGFGHIPLTPAVRDAYVAMAQAYQAESGKDLPLQSGYRSVGYQLAAFNSNLYKYGFDFGKTLRVVDLPGYSNHHNLDAPAIGVSSEGRKLYYFKTTAAYEWLKTNASRFGFSLSNDHPWVLEFAEPSAAPEPKKARQATTPDKGPSVAGLVAPEPVQAATPDLLALNEEAKKNLDFSTNLLRKMLLARPFYSVRFYENIPDAEHETHLSRYAAELLLGMQLADIRIDPRNISHLLTIRMMESGFQNEISRTGTTILKEAGRLESAAISAIESLLELQDPSLYQKYKDIQSSLDTCKTETDLYQWAQNLRCDLIGQLGSKIRNNASLMLALSTLIKSKLGTAPEDPVDYLIGYLDHKPSTIGRNQINVDIVIKNAARDLYALKRDPCWKSLVRGEEGRERIDRDKLVRSLVAHVDTDTSLLPRPVAEAFILKYYFLPIIEANDLNGNGIVDDNELKFVAADFHAGLYASRNAAVQAVLNQTRQFTLSLDGDLCLYDKNSNPDPSRTSNTENALIEFVRTSNVDTRGKTPHDFVKSFTKVSKMPYLENHPLWAILFKNPQTPQRVIPAEAATTGFETKLSGFAVTDTQRYSDRVTTTIRAL